VREHAVELHKRIGQLAIDSLQPPNQQVPHARLARCSIRDAHDQLLMSIRLLTDQTPATLRAIVSA
jgi:hypothetical protein